MKKGAPGKARFPWRVFLYGIIVLYLVGDLYWFGGPLRQKIDSRQPYSKYSRERAVKNGWVAVVNGEPITRRQLDRAVFLYFYRRGKDLAKASDLDRRLARLAALRELVQDALVRQHARAEKFVADPKLVERHIAAFESQFPDAEELKARSDAQGLSAKERRALLTEEITGRLWLEKRVSPATEVTEAEAREWFEENREEGEGFRAPEVIRARHIFLSTVVDDTEGREEQIREIHRKLAAGEVTFEDLAAQVSEDERNKLRGGDLNWFSADRMPEDFFGKVNALEIGELGEPFRTSIGWHVAELTGRRPARDLSFEELKPEIFARVESERRRHAVGVLLEKLETASAIEIFPEVLDAKAEKSGEAVKAPQSRPEPVSE